MYPQLSLFINGQFLSGDGRTEQAVTNPATLEMLGQLPHATRADLDHALESAQRAFSSWRKTSAIERSALLRKAAALIRERAAEIGANITRDQGKPLADATFEVASAAEHAEWHAEECRRIYGRTIPARNPAVRQLALREPVGVCAAFSPWNFPFAQAIRKVVAAVGAGCTIILKGPEDSPSAVVALARIFHDAGLPPGVLNTVWGVPSEVSEYLVRSPIVRKVSFTGSVPVGKQLAGLAGQHMKRMTMELGGHAPVLVFDDADLDPAADLMAAWKVRNAGQVCVSPTRFFVQEKVYERFMDRFVSALRAVSVGNGMDAGVQMGPLAHERRVTAMTGLLDDAKERGGRIVLGGSPMAGSGHFFAPSVVTDLPQDARLMTDEPFGPVATLSRFKDEEEAIAQANRLPFGLAAYVFTQSQRRATAVSNALEAGMVNINHFGMGLPETPFGGIKDSGFGSEGGSETFDGYLVTKFITQI